MPEHGRDHVEIEADSDRRPRRPTEGRELPGGYQLREQIGVGGMGEVWRGFDTRLEREVAIKLVRPVDQQKLFEDRLVREARAIARLRHPALVTIYDIGRDEDGAPFLVMELLQGESLGDWFEVHGGCGGERAVRLLLPIAAALVAVHEAGVIHRDLKLDNVFLARTSRGKLRPTLIDFGIARLDERGTQLTAGLLGTPEFMAPEQIVLGEPVGPAADQWALSVSLYLLATGRHPFRTDDVARLFRSIREAPLPFPRDKSFDGRLFRILARGTRKNAQERYPSMADLRDALRTWLEESAAAPGAPTAAERTKPVAVAPAAPKPSSVAATRGTLDAAIKATFGGGD